MAAQKGKDLLLKVDSDGGGTFTTVAGLRSRSIAFNAEYGRHHARRNPPANGASCWPAPASKSARVTGSGIFKDAASDEIVRGYVFDGTIRDWQVVIPDFGTVQGPFHIGSFELTGRHDGEVTFDIALESAGELTFAAA